MERKKIVVLTGAGISAESGISTFRDADGLWNNHNVADVATPEGFRRNPQMVLDFYNDMHRTLPEKQPNRGHTGLAELQEMHDVWIITQNIDDLHERAGSRHVLHLHGELMKACSSRNVKLTVPWPAGQDLEVGGKAPDGSQIRPFIVWFGEAVPNIGEAVNLVRCADVFLVVGTSLNVYPAAGLMDVAPKGCPIYLIDPKPVATARNVKVIAKPASRGIEDFLAEMNSIH